MKRINKQVNNNKGFTLAELLAVIVVIAVIGAIVFPNIFASIKKSKEKSYNIQVDIYNKAAKKWITQNLDSLNKQDEYHLNNINITLTTLKKERYIDDRYTVNPLTKKVMAGCIVATYDANKESYNFEYNDGENELNSSASDDDKYNKEIAGCDSYKGFVYTYDSQLKPTNGVKKSDGTTITPQTILANFLIGTNDANLVKVGQDYYYQGLNPNNYVKIEGSDLIWRVLSINKDKTIKLIATGESVNSTLLSTSVFNSSAYQTSVDLKTNLEAELNEINTTIIREENVFSIGSITDLATDYNVIASEEKQTDYTGKIGVITPSEYLKTISTSTNNSYLKPTNSSTYWTMNYKDNKHIIIDSEGLKEANIDTTTRGVYATIVINANVIKKSGTGISSDPYIIK